MITSNLFLIVFQSLLSNRFEIAYNSFATAMQSLLEKLPRFSFVIALHFLNAIYATHSTARLSPYFYPSRLPATFLTFLLYNATLSNFT
jgi:hypothetical protein